MADVSLEWGNDFQLCYNERMTKQAEFYVYALFRLDTGEPFYIGKGRGKRIGQVNRRNPYTLAVIAKMKGLGLDVPMIKLRSGLTEAEAFAAEVALIAAIGRDPEGPLTNMTDGGEGFVGGRHGPETRAKLALNFKGRKHSPESIEKIRAAKLGKPVHSVEARAKIGVASSGRRHSEDHKEKMRQKMTGRVFTEEWRQKIIASNTGKKRSETIRAVMSESRKGRKASEETRRKIALAGFGRKHTPESIEKMRAVQKGRIVTEEHRRKIGAANKGQKRTPEQCRAISDGLKRRRRLEMDKNGGCEPRMA